MPYSANSELPQSVRDKYSDKCQRAFRHAFNSVHEKTGDEGRAAAAGHTAAQQCQGRRSMSPGEEFLMDDVTQYPSTFKIISGMLKAYEQPDATGESRKRFKTTASSTVKDLVGDEISLEAIQKMADEARDNMTIYLNHKYDVPEDVLGSVEQAHVVQRGLDADGNPIVDLDLDIALNDTNPRAVQTWAAIDRGVKLGTSIGAKVLHATKKKGGGLVIDDVKLLEASLVGIPANQRSWVHYATKSLAGLTMDEDTIIEEAEPDIEKSEAPVEPTTETVEASAEADVTKADETETPDDDKLAGKTRVTVTVDSDAQEAPPRSEPGNARDAVADETADGDDEKLNDNVTRSEDTNNATFNVSVDTFQGAHDALTSAKSEILALTKQVEDLTAERDDLVANLDVAKRLLDRVSRLPLARKAQPTVDVASSVSKYGGVIDPEVLKLLERK